MNQPKLRHRRWWAIGLFISVSILFVIVIRHTKNAKQPAPANEIKPAELTSCDHLIEARKALIDGYKPGDDPLKTLWGRKSSWGQIFIVDNSASTLLII
ncbi:MAG: hypothetical protein NG747_11455 [Candidatus Brocadia sp.]|nr:hypothetical protein [Candidatus Brocadia sp.]